MHKKRQYLKFLSDMMLGKTVVKIFQLPWTLQIEISQSSTLKKKNLSNHYGVIFPKELEEKRKKKTLNPIVELNHFL